MEVRLTPHRLAQGYSPLGTRDLDEGVGADIAVAAKAISWDTKSPLCRNCLACVAAVFTSALAFSSIFFSIREAKPAIFLLKPEENTKRPLQLSWASTLLGATNLHQLLPSRQPPHKHRHEVPVNIIWTGRANACLTVEDAELQNGRRLQLRDCGGAAGSQLRGRARFFIPDEGTSGAIRWAQHPELCLSELAGGTLQFWDCDQAGPLPLSSQFSMVRNGNMVRIASMERPSLCVSIANGDWATSEEITLENCNSTHGRARSTTFHFLIREVPRGCEWFDWGSWSHCPSLHGKHVNGSVVRARPVVCDGGRRSLVLEEAPFKKVAQNVPSKACQGSSCEWELCSLRTCDQSVWQDWSACSTTCGVGKRVRIRQLDAESAKANGRRCPGTMAMWGSCRTKSCPSKSVPNGGTKLLVRISWAELPGSCLGMERSRVPAGAKLIMQECGKDDQFFIPSRTLTTSAPCSGLKLQNCTLPFSIQWALNPALCLDVPGRSDFLQFWKCGKGNADNFRFLMSTDRGEGTEIRWHRHPDKCLVLPHVRGNYWTRVKLGDCSYNRGNTIASTGEGNQDSSANNNHTSTRGKNDHSFMHFTVHPIRQSCKWGDWSEWSACSKTCGVGIHERFRRITLHPSSGDACEGSTKEVQLCSSRECSLWPR